MPSPLFPKPKRPLIIAGPTGVGKSHFAVELALQIDGEIVGADAYQVYAGMAVLTAQPGPELQDRVPHHLIGVVPPSECFDAAQFVIRAQEAMAEITARGRRPILVGGSGLYLKALTHGLVELPPVDPELRAELAATPPEELCRRLDEVDPEARQYLDFQNPRRVQRALEIHQLTGRTAASQREQWQGEPKMDFEGILLTREREELKSRIAENVRIQFEHGVLAEVAALGELGATASRAIGLREIQALLGGVGDEESTSAAIVQATTRYAKRQLTWFRNQTTFAVTDITGLRDAEDFLTDSFISGLN